MPHLTTSQLEVPVDPLWYKDAIIYEVHVRAFFDSDDTGVGDFPGLTQKLDYLQSLGINALWLLPFYPSPLRDDGYDIAKYEGIHSAYGTLRDFKTFLREAHGRGIRVITELVLNHTSSDHPWFQAARRSPPGSSKRHFYVWGDTDKKHPDVRVMFVDTEKSNWTWDTEAKAYYWHRFFHHQPDLNYDNPKVRRAMLRVMRFWFDLGVDGMRLDAVPYLIEREGTNCENLPETHDVLKEIRRELDARYTARMLLAEANQWPADVRAYFGDNDECHMAFHFPLMPRIFMALRLEDRHPITEILRQTPEIPDACQWALFLRNHDELTLEMVTDEERDYMYQAYAADPQMRINIGIRRRLAPLVENSRRRIELLNSLLLSMPGTPVIYYGDEIGMGDNIYLGDRNGVRTPMQWTSDRNGGFSKVDPARLYLPIIMDPVYGYQAINVEAQERSEFSLLSWMKRMIAVRKQHKTFSRGTIEVLHPQNRKILAYVRRYEDETILVTANLSRAVQPAELNLSDFADLTPIEMLGRTAFPRIERQPYFLTFGPYAFYWFELTRAPAPITTRVPTQPAIEIEEMAPLLAGGTWETLLNGAIRHLLERDYLRPFLGRQRWFGGKSRDISSVRFRDWGLLVPGAEPTFFIVLVVTYAEGGDETYFVPLALRSAHASTVAHSFPPETVAPITGARKGVLFDALLDDGVGERLAEVMLTNRGLATREGVVRGFVSPGFTGITPDELRALKVFRGATEQSNTSLIFDERWVLKIFRRLEPGPNPELEVTRHLSEKVGFTRVPPLAGAIEYVRGGAEPVTLGVLQGFMSSQANGWDHALDELGRFYDRVTGQAAPPETKAEPSPLHLVEATPPPRALETVGIYLDAAGRLGKRTAELHLALADDRGDPAFTPEPLTSTDLRQYASEMRSTVLDALQALQRSIGMLRESVAERAAELLAHRDELLRHLDALAVPDTGAMKIRVHGDYHLGQVLWSEGDFYIIDFEGEPARPLEEHRMKRSPLKDVAGMVRSFSYAAYAGLFAYTVNRPADFARLEPWARAWQAWTAGVFLRTYFSTAATGPLVPKDRDHLKRLLDAFTLQKAAYELLYELNNRPDWVRIPILGMWSLLGSGTREALQE
ncbi:MAG: maltose alpha-D-glucosyltransferase [Acidobacteria bacterium]|nr:maltose alpha-D-glucosyltransferase [Acidobacteriota bacterium]